MGNRIGIISYLPDTEPIRSDRYSFALRQFDWLDSVEELKDWDCYMVAQNLGEIKSCLFAYDADAHKTQVKQCLEGFLTLHSNYFTTNQNGTVNWKSFNTKYNRAVPILKIKRGCPIKNPDDDWFTVRHRHTSHNKKRRSLI